MVTDRDLRLAVLDALSRVQYEHRNNLVGSPYPEQATPSPLEVRLGGKFDDELRDRAHDAIDWLLRSKFVRATSAVTSRDRGWIEISDAGRAAVKRRALDTLDILLAELSPHLVDVRQQMWSFVELQTGENSRAAANAARELFNQSMRLAAPDEVVKSHAWYEKTTDEGSKDVTPRQRVRHILESRRTHPSGRLPGLYDKLATAAAAIGPEIVADVHRNEAVSVERVRRLVLMYEVLLEEILARGSN